jgi:predicted ATPase
MVDSSSENNTLKRAIADEAYDNNETFQYLSDKSIEAAIKVRKESSSYGSRSIGYQRKIATVRKQLKNLNAKWMEG